MTSLDLQHPSLNPSKLADSVVVITKGASGIGAEAVRQFHDLGAKVIFGDLDEELGRKLVESTSIETVHFVKSDIRDHKQNFALFELAVARYGRVDHAIANAGMIEQLGRFDPRIGIESVKAESFDTVLDINLKAVLLFAHIACAYLADDGTDEPRDKSLTLLSSIAGWKEYPELFAYPASKYGFLGLMRSLRAFVLTTCPTVRVNAVCPGLTDVGMVHGTRAGWNSTNLPVNTPKDVASVLVAVSAAGPGTETVWHDPDDTSCSTGNTNTGVTDWNSPIQNGLNGRTLHVMGGECY